MKIKKYESAVDLVPDIISLAPIECFSGNYYLENK